MRSPLYALAVLLGVLIVPSSAHAYVLGAADGSTEAAPIAAQLGAKTYRLVMDSTVPLEAYAPRIETYRALGMHPQIVVDGTGTSVRGRTGKNWQTINYAIHAFKRWPDAYSVSVFNEPDLAGISACRYADTFRRAYKMLKRAGVPRVLFGEWSPANAERWTMAVQRCRHTITADGFAWHCYDWAASWAGITKTGMLSKVLKGSRHYLHTRRGAALPMYCTEYGVPTPGRYSFANQNGAHMWGRAFAYVRKYHVKQIVAWGILEVGGASEWDTSTVAADGTPRPAFFTIASASR